MAQSAFRIEGLSNVLRMVKGLAGNATSKDLMGRIGAYIVTQILQRTGRGVDVDSRPFEPYSSKYKLFRMKAGRPHDKVNLFFHGSMLSSLTYKEAKDKVEVFFMRTYGKTPYGKPSKVSNPQKAFFLNQNREFFGISARDEAEVERMILDNLRRIIKEA